MQKLFSLFLLLIPFVSIAQRKHGSIPKKTLQQTSATAVQMKEFYFVMLTKGANRDKITDTATLNQLQAGHMANITSFLTRGNYL